MKQKSDIAFDFLESFYYSSLPIIIVSFIFTFIFILKFFLAIFLFPSHKLTSVLNMNLIFAFLFAIFIQLIFIFAFMLAFFIILIFKVFIFLIVISSTFIILTFFSCQHQTLYLLLSMQEYCLFVNYFYFASMLAWMNYYWIVKFMCYFSSMRVVIKLVVIWLSSMKVGLKWVMNYLLFINFFSSMVG